MAERFGTNVNNLRAALASVGMSKAPMAPGRKPKNAPSASTQASSTQAPSAQAVSERVEVSPVASAQTPSKKSAAEKSLDSMRAQMGTAPDADIAARAGVDVDAIKAYRREHQIPAFRRPPPVRVSAASKAAPAAPRARSGESDQVVRRRAKDAVGMGEVVKRTPAPASVTDAAPAIATPAIATPAIAAPASAAQRAGARTPVVAEASNPLEGYRDQLGKVADHVIGEQANVDRTVVGAWRRKLGIPAYTDFRKRKATDGAVKAPKAAERAAAKAASKPAPKPAAKAAPKAADAPATTGARTKGKPGRRSAIDAYADLVGKMTDADVAAKANVSTAAVTQYRIRRGIPAAGRAAARSAEAVRAPAARVASGVSADAAKGVRHRRSKLDAYAHLVGTLSDSEVALLADVSSEGVRQYRRRHGIPAAGTRVAEVEAATPVAGAPVAAAPVAAAPVSATPVSATPAATTPVAAPKAAPAAAAPTARAKVAAPAAAGLVAYGVTARQGDENRRFVVFGGDFQEAVARAVHALDARADGPWVVQAVRRLCDALA